jgi:integrase
LRHTKGTELRQRYGIEAARVVLGHSNTKTTEIYAERDLNKAAEIMQQIG